MRRVALASALVVALSCSTELVFDTVAPGPDGDGGPGGADGAADDAASGPADGGTPRCAWDAPFTSTELIAIVDAAPDPLGAAPRFAADETTAVYPRGVGLETPLFIGTRIEPATIRQDRMLALGSEDFPSAALSADGRTLVAQRETELVRVTDDAGDGTFRGPVTRLVADAGFELSMPFLAQHAPELLYVSRGAGVDYGESIWRVGLDGTNEERVLDDAYDPVLSPDGLTLYFLRDGATYALHRSDTSTPFADVTPTPFSFPQEKGPQSLGWVSADECRLYYRTTFSYLVGRRTLTR